MLRIYSREKDVIEESLNVSNHVQQKTAQLSCPTENEPNRTTISLLNVLKEH